MLPVKMVCECPHGPCLADRDTEVGQKQPLPASQEPTKEGNKYIE